MRKLANKFLRDNAEQKIVRQLRRISPNYDSYLSSIKQPKLPKIVLYSNHPNPSEYLNKILPQYKYIKGTPSSNDLQMSKKIAEESLTYDQKRYNGIFFQGFPFNVNQALHLDNFLGGVNLALYISSNEAYKNQIAPMLSYYQDKGVLLEIQERDSPTIQQIQKIRWNIQANLKISE